MEALLREERSKRQRGDLGAIRGGGGQLFSRVGLSKVDLFNSVFHKKKGGAAGNKEWGRRKGSVSIQPQDSFPLGGSPGAAKSRRPTLNS